MRKTVFLKHVFLAIAMLAISLPSWGDGEGIPSRGQSWVARYQFVENWENATDPTDGSDTPWYSPDFNDTSWPTLTGLLDGNNWNAEYSAYYLRRSFTMPEVKDGSYILIVNHDDLVRIYLNGTFIGEREECGTHDFVIPSGLLTEGENLLAIYIDDRGGGGRYLDYGLQRVLTAQTIEGVDMTFKVISENEKTCMVGIDEDNVASITETYNGGITIPSVVNGYTVTRIGKWAFYGRTGLTSIDIPSSVTSIGRNAFGCCSLASVSLPENLETIDGDAFGGCESLTSIVIPASVTSIGDYIFAGCRGLTSIVVEDGNTVYDSRDNCNAIIETSTNTLIAGCKNTIIPNTVTCIGVGAFNDLTNLTSIEIPSSVTTLKWWAFHDCGLTSINIPAGVTSIEAGAFEYCPNLTSVTVNNPNPISFEYMDLGFDRGNAVLYVPAGRIDAYANANYWKDFNVIVENGDAIHIMGQSWDARYQFVENWYYVAAPVDGNDNPWYSPNFDDSAWPSLTGPLDNNNWKTEYSGYFLRRTFTLSDVKDGYYLLTAVYDFYDRVKVYLNGTLVGEKECVDGANNYDFAIPSSLFVQGENSLAIFVGDSQSYDQNYGRHFDYQLCYIGNNAKYYIDNQGVVYKRDGDSYYVKGYIGEPSSVTIPEELFNLPVTRIGRHAFRFCTSLSSVTFPSSLATIDDCAFAFCSNLPSITFPSGLTSIGDAAFGRCSNFTSITLPSSLTSIGNVAFDSCSNLTSITLPSGLTNIGEGTFINCGNLTSVVVNNPIPVALFNGDVFPNHQNATLYVPVGSKSAYENADYWKDFKEIKEIGADVVFTAQTAEGVDMTFKVISENEKTCMVGIEEYGVASITETYNGGITIPSEVNGYTVKRIGKWALCGRGGLTSVSIPETVESIGTQAFNFTGLTAITLPSNLKTIEDGVFQGCTGITSVTIPASVTSIAVGTFDDANLASIKVENGNQVYDSRNDCNAIIETATNTLVIGCQNTAIPDDVEIIGTHAFVHCYGLESITIPSSVKSIGGRAFFGCSNLASVSLPENLETIDGDAFGGCESLTSIVIPASVTSIGDYIFAGCRGLTSIVVEDGNTVYDCRDNCNAIIETSTNTLIAGCKNTIIPNTVTCIGGGAFNDLTNLTSIEIPSSVTTLKWWAFHDCGLTSINIPAGVTTIEAGAFEACDNLTSVTVNNPVPVDLSCGGIHTSYVFSNYANATLYVPAGSKSAYEAADYWKDFKEIKEIVSVTDISQMDNVIYIEPVEARSGSELTLSVKMKNNVEMESFGFDMVLPEGITVATDVDGYAMAELSTERTSTRKTNVFGADFKEDGSLNVQAYSTNGSTISGYDGEIALITIKLASDLIAGDYPILLKNIAMADAGAVTYRVESVTCKLTVPAYKLGDANSDGYVDVGDLTAISHKILNRPDESFNPKAADANEDSSIDVGDLTAVSHIILWGSVQRPQNAPKKRQEPMIEPE